ncbi:MAG: NAD-dependent deacylase [Bacteroidales bacterium]|nr:NAD-dependent deacylase [Bacteroidales bacterium]
MENQYQEAAGMIANAKRVTGFTGAGISVESGIPPFRGEDGLWNKYDPDILLLDNYTQNTREVWQVIKKLFFDFFGDAQPNKAHEVLAWMERQGFLADIITQNIDNLHQKAGNTKVYEFHGNSRQFVCMRCSKIYPREDIELTEEPPSCPSCGGLLKPDFIFFGEPIPSEAYSASVYDARHSDVFLVIGTAGNVFPASQVPLMAKETNTKIIEINPEKSLFTNDITDVFLRGKASEVMEKLEKYLQSFAK